MRVRVFTVVCCQRLVSQASTGEIRSVWPHSLFLLLRLVIVLHQSLSAVLIQIQSVDYLNCQCLALLLFVDGCAFVSGGHRCYILERIAQVGHFYLFQFRCEI